MKRVANQPDSESREDATVVPSSGDPDGYQAPTVAYTGPEPSAPEVEDEVAENERTIISNRPAASVGEFYQSMPLARLASLLEGRRLDHFIVEQMIGGGGMGAVFRGRDERLDRIVAIKVVPAARRDAETLRRFRLEAQAAAKLDHPNIARVYYVGQADQWNYIVFEFIDGVNLRDLVAMHGPLSIDDAVYYTRQVAEALEHAHQRGVVHRDIKPSNILITANGVAKVVDMGLARHTAVDRSTADETASGITLGTFDYISPEQARNPRDADVRSDLYSLGCTLFYMLTGNPPFPEGTALQKLLNHGSLPPPDPRAWRDDISDQLYAIMMKLMAKQPSDRYQKPVDLVNDLMLLAEVENLPRSQTPGTILMAPTVAQRSLLETNLPWVFALAFLLGSALWLQVQDVSSRFSLPPLNFEAPPAATARRPAADTPAVSPDRGASARPTPGARDALTLPERPAALQAVVVAPRQADAAEARWAPTFDQAMRTAVENTEVREIILRQDAAMTTPVTLPSNRTIILRGEGQPRPTLQVGAEVWQRTAAARAVEINGGQIQFENLQVLIDFGVDTAPRPAPVFLHLAGPAQASFRHCTITAVPRVRPSAERMPTVVSSLPSAARNVLPAPPYGTTRVILERSIVRGECQVVAWSSSGNPRDAAEFNVRECLVATAGPLLAVRQRLLSESSSSPSQIDPTAAIQVLCQQSTIVSREPNFLMDFGGVTAPSLALHRVAGRTIFASTGGRTHVALRGISPTNLLGPIDWIRLEGRENYYDASIRSLCNLQDQYGAEIFVFDFKEGANEGWFSDEDYLRSVPWQTPLSDGLELSRAEPADFAVAPDARNAGFRDILPP
ncbi:MAG: serine/threonine protein kinase [Planctomycetota bacterium]|nr:MAG: serine/threonine protein kinase [Planctomycetota bacterium]